MKNLLLALPLIAGVSWAGTTLYSGAQTQPAYNRLLAQLNNSKILAVKSVEYEAGFTSSTAITEVRLNNSKTDERVYLQHKINHSPVSMVPENARFGAAKIVTTLMVDKFEDEDTKAFFKSFDTGEPLVVHTDVAIDGTTASEITINAFDQSNDDNDINIKTSGATLNLLTTATGSVSGDGSVRETVFSDGATKAFKMLGNQIKLDFEKIEEAFFNAKFDMTLDEVLVTDKSISEQPIFQLKDAYFGMDQQLTNDKPYLKQSVGIKRLTSDFVPLKSVDLTTELADFSIDEALANADLFRTLKTSEDFATWVQTDEFVSLLRATFIPDTSISINANAKTTQGDADAAIKLWFAGNGTADGYTGMVTTGDLAKAIAGTAKIHADKSALMMTPLGGMLEDSIAQIYLKITDDTVSLDAKLEELILTLNGQMLPLEFMAGDVLQMPLGVLLQ